MSQMERIQNNLGVRRTRGAPPAGCGRGRKGHAERSSPYGPGCRERSLRSWGQAQGPLCGSVPGFGTAPGNLRCGQRRAAGKQPGRQLRKAPGGFRWRTADGTAAACGHRRHTVWDRWDKENLPAKGSRAGGVRSGSRRLILDLSESCGVRGFAYRPFGM